MDKQITHLQRCHFINRKFDGKSRDKSYKRKWKCHNIRGNAKPNRKQDTFRWSVHLESELGSTPVPALGIVPEKTNNKPLEQKRMSCFRTHCLTVSVLNQHTYTTTTTNPWFPNSLTVSVLTRTTCFYSTDRERKQRNNFCFGRTW